MTAAMRRDFVDFIRAFSDSSGCLQQCHCGTTYYAPSGSWDWDAGELERLAASDAVAVDADEVALVEINGHRYADCCLCLEPVAEGLIRFLRGNDQQVATFLELVRAREIAAASELPVVKSRRYVAKEWRPMDSAPKGRWVMVLMADGSRQRAHFAEDLSGESQPPFSGWYVDGGGNVFRPITPPIAWQDDFTAPAIVD